VRKLVERGENLLRKIKGRGDPPPFPLAHNSPSKPFSNLSNLYQITVSHSAISAIGSSISRVPFKIRSIHIVASPILISIRPHLTGHTPPFPSLKQISKKVPTHLRVLQISLALPSVPLERFK
jgi:hypothetical protein